MKKEIPEIGKFYHFFDDEEKFKKNFLVIP